jgi:hypothetical protein
MVTQLSIGDRVKKAANIFTGSCDVITGYKELRSRECQIVKGSQTPTALSNQKYSKLAEDIELAGDFISFALKADKAWIAYNEGHEYIATGYAVAASVDAFEIVVTGYNLTKGAQSASGAASKIATKLSKSSNAITAAIGGIQCAAYILEAQNSDDPIYQKACYANATATVMDTAIALSSPYAIAVTGAWAITVEVFSAWFHNDLADSVCSSIGSAIVFWFEFCFGKTIPPPIPELALKGAIGEMEWVVTSYAELGEHIIPLYPPREK